MQNVTEDDLLHLLRLGPFHVALQAAIQSRGLSLETLQQRLSEQGIRVSLSSLSYWQRGRTRPVRADSLRAVRGLETILRLPRYSLLTLLRPLLSTSADRSPAGASMAMEEICPEPGVRDLLEEIGDHADGRLTGLSLHDRHVIGPRRDLRELRTRAVLQAHRHGVDRWLAVYHSPHHGALPTRREASRCRFGRVRADPDSGLIAAELLFDRSLRQGETYLLEYGFGFEGPGPAVTQEGRGFRLPQHEYLLEIQFHPEVLPARCYRTWRPDAQTAVTDTADLRMSSSHAVHFIEFGVAGYHGIRWEWD
ncbi:MAG: hypothetical protein JWN52_7238 [Actinomycetia bacterium]|nr:hypothetical protein [Actinomycetes bacterium]